MRLSEYSAEELGWLGMGGSLVTAYDSVEEASAAFERIRASEPPARRYRVAWKSLLTGHASHGDRLTDLSLAEAWAQAMNAHHREITHWVETEGAWTCPLCTEENTGETCATQWCRLTPAQAEIAAGWIACAECGCGHPDITNGGERCPACKAGDARVNWYWGLLEDLRAGRLS